MADEGRLLSFHAANAKGGENFEVVAGKVGAREDWTQWRFDLGSASNKEVQRIEFFLTLMRTIGS